MLRHVLVPLDESELAEQALPYARQIIDPQNGKITLLSVVYVPEYITSGLYPVPFEYQIESYEQVRKKRVDRAREYLNGIADSLKDELPEIDIMILTGNPADRITDSARDLNVDAIVMSTHGRSGIMRWVFGSVAQGVIQTAPCPIFVIPSREKPTD